MNIIEKFLSEKAAAEAAEKARLAAIEEEINKAFKDFVSGIISDDRDDSYVSETEDGLELKLEITLTDKEKEFLKHYKFLNGRERILSHLPKIDGYSIYKNDISYWDLSPSDISIGIMDKMTIIYNKDVYSW